MAKIEATITQAPKAVASIEKAVPAGSDNFMFGKINYQLTIAGLILIALGFILMAGGRSEDPNVFNASELYSFRRITLAPILVIAGFIVEMVAIMKLPKD